MSEDQLARLEKVGLSTAEAQIYLALLRSGSPMGASGIVAATGVPRGSIYPTLSRLVDMGLVHAEAGYGGRFSPVPAEQGLASLMAHEREELSHREQLARELGTELRSTRAHEDSYLEGELIEVIRDPRVLADRWQKLEREAKREIDALVKAPMILKTKDTTGNPAEAESLRRGVRHRAIYESKALVDEHITPFLKAWIEAGEEAREFEGTLPFKLVLFDNEIVWVPLETAAKRHPVVSVFIRHRVLAEGLQLLFEYLWKDSQPIKLKRRQPAKSPAPAMIEPKTAIHRNGRGGHPPHKYKPPDM